MQAAMSEAVACEPSNAMPEVLWQPKKLGHIRMPFCNLKASCDEWMPALQQHGSCMSYQCSSAACHSNSQNNVEIA